jgi:hypothetical protein
LKKTSGPQHIFPKSSSNIENLVFWARTEIIGLAVIEWHGVLDGVTDGKHQPSMVKSKADSFGQDY